MSDLSPEGPASAAEPKTWTYPICEECWADQHPRRRPSEMLLAARYHETCAFCGDLTNSGIYVRSAPRETAVNR